LILNQSIQNKMKKILTVCALASSFLLIGSILPKDNRNKLQAENIFQEDGPVDADCKWNGISLHGKIKFVESFPDIKVQIVESFPDLKVKLVDAFPGDCGEWQVVESFPDFKVQVVESFPDIKIQFVESFPGMP
jgi:hypothetical protein